MENKICIGKLVKTHGVKGEIKVLPLTDDVKRFNSLKQFYIADFSGAFTCEKVRICANDVFLKIQDINSPEEAMKFNGKNILVDRTEAVKLKQDEYYYADLIDSKVVYNNDVIGKIIDIENYGASDILVIKTQKNVLNVVFLVEIIKNFDIFNKILYVTDRFFEVAVWE